MAEPLTLLALFTEIDPTVLAIDRLHEMGIADEKMEIISGIPFNQEVLGRPQLPTFIPRLALGGAMIGLVAALFLLGLGWNFAYVAGSTLLADQLSPEERAKTQGFNDLLLNLASGASQIGSGVIYASGGFGVMGLAAAAAAVVPLTLAIWWQATAAQKR